MNLKEEISKTLDRINAYFSSEQKESNKARTLDGNMVEWDGEILGSGAKFYVMSSEGRVSAETGQYELESGDIVVVESGVVVDFLAKQHEEMNAFSAQEFADAVVAAVESRLKAVEDVIAKNEAKLAEIETKLSESKSSEAESILKAVEELKAELSEISVEKPARSTETQFSEKPTSKYAAYFAELKNQAAEREKYIPNFKPKTK